MFTTARSTLASLAITATLALPSAASAITYTTATLPSLNTNIATWTDGGVYAPLFPGTQTLAGVPFAFQGAPNSNNSVVAQGYDIGVSVFGATTVYTLINTAWGTLGANVGSITFTGSAGASHTVQLIEGDNVRDHYFGGYVNTLTADYVTLAVVGVNAPNRAHLDMQAFALPAAFQTQTLTNIVFNSTGGNPAGMPVLVAATVAAVPEVQTYALLLAGLGVVALRARRRSGR